MALLWMEGFEGGDSPLDTYMGRRYDYTGATPGVASGYTRIAGVNGGYALNMGGTYNFFGTPPLTTDATLIIGMAFKSNSASSRYLFRCYQQETGAGIGVYTVLSGSTRELRVYRRDTQIGSDTSTGNAFQVGRWHWIEVKIYCHDTAGTVEIRYGGQTIFSFTGDTKAGSLAYHDVVAFATGNTFDNIYICDSTGSQCNDFLGPCRITRINPAANGDYSQWTPSAAVDHYSLVDDDPQGDDDATYVESAVSGDRELWGYADASNLGTIHAIQIVTLARSTDAACPDFKILAKSGSESEDSIHTVAYDYSFATRIMETQIGGSAWNQAALNGYQFGVRVG